MKTTITCGAVALSLAASHCYAQSVEEMLGFSVSGVQTSSMPTEGTHATAEDSPFYLTFTVDPVIEGTIDIKDSSAASGTPSILGNQVQFDLGVGLGITFGWRIPDSYVIIQLTTGFTWNGVREFNGTFQIAPGTFTSLSSNEGNLYQIPILLSPGLEFDLGGGWPFLHGSVIRFGPTIGMTYHDLSVSDIKRGDTRTETYSFGARKFVFAYGAFVSLDFFFEYNMALSIGYQFMGTSPINYGDFTGVNAGGVTTASIPDVKTNFTFTNIVKCGISIYF